MTAIRKPHRARAPSPRNFYRGALDAAEDEQLDLAAAAEGLDDEVALLRVLIRRELQERPEDLRLALQGLTLLVRAVAARYRLSPADQEALERRIVEAVRMITESVDQEVIDA